MINLSFLHQINPKSVNHPLVPFSTFPPNSNSRNKKLTKTTLNSSGRIPALVDNRAGKGPINVWESASILLYLARVYDTKFAFHFEDEDVEAEMINWIFFIQGGLGPMQVRHFPLCLSVEYE